MTASDTTRRAKKKAKTAGMYCEIDLSFIKAGRSTVDCEQRIIALFQRLIPSLLRRAQLLQHVATFGARDCFYYVASLIKVLYIVRVRFSLSTLSFHCNVLQAAVLGHMGWI